MYYIYIDFTTKIDLNLISKYANDAIFNEVILIDSDELTSDI